MSNGAHEDQPTRPPATAAAAAVTWCEWHGGFTRTGVLIAAVEQVFGPGAHLYACASCRERYRLTPWPDLHQS